MCHRLLTCFIPGMEDTKSLSPTRSLTECAGECDRSTIATSSSDQERVTKKAKRQMDFSR